ncbi:MAG: hypothetical protein E6J61_20870 [Deltaproteobacteria bacterium]|nr:MAG: hypothetical protein E6J61_20870 [Deltaproteobacteria bacterium]
MARPDVASGKGTRTEEEQRSLVAAPEVYAGRYAVVREIGRGGMGRVLLARDLKLSRNVAVKVLPTGAHDPRELERFDKEARAAGCLNHPNVVDVHDVGEHEGEPYLVTELLEGKTLREVLANGPLPVGESIDLARQIAAGRAAAHEHGIVHRDVKPENLFITHEGRLKILDFGVAHVSPQDMMGPRSPTDSAAVLGTVSYMSPEQVRGRAVDARSDLFAFGSVLHEMLSGAPPFERATPLETAHAILNDALPPLPSYVPPTVVSIVERCLRRDAAERFQSVGELAHSLDAVSSRPPARVRRWITIIAAAMLVSALAGALAVRFFPRGDGAARYTVAAADFVNETGERELDGLSGMLITALEQSRRISVLTRSRMFDILKQMGRSDADRIDEPLGRSICKQAGVGGLVLASIRRFGEVYTVDLKLLDPVKNEYLLTAKQQAKGKESIPGMIDRLSDELRTGLKEKESDLRAARIPVAQSTTANVEAYEHFFRGEQLFSRGWDVLGAERELRRALELDPGFALARLWLARALNFRHRDRRVYADLKTAVEQANRLPERDLCVARCELLLHEGREREAMEMVKQCATRFPADKRAIRTVADWSFHAGDLDTAAIFFEKERILDPLDLEAVDHLMRIWRERERYDRMIEQLAQPQWVSEPRQHFLTRFAVDMIRGRYRKALADLEKDAASALREGDSERAATDLLSQADVLVDNLDDLEGSRRAAAGVRSIQPHRVLFALYLKHGDFDRASALVSANEAVQVEAASYLVAARDVWEGRLGSAISRYESLARDPVWGTYTTQLRLADLYARAGEPQKAIRALQSFQSHAPGIGIVTNIVRSHVRLGRMYEAAAEPRSAEREYRWVLRMWSDADPDLKELAEVRGRLAALERSATK